MGSKREARGKQEGSKREARGKQDGWYKETLVPWTPANDEKQLNFQEESRMPKNIPQPVPEAQEQHEKVEEPNTMAEPLSGSKKVKNRNHSRQNKGGGSAM